MINALRHNYGKTLWLTRLVLALSILFCDLFSVSTFFGLMAMMGIKMSGTFAGYVLDMRIRTAICLLTKTDYTYTQIAYSLAFCSQLCIFLVQLIQHPLKQKFLEAAPLHMHLNASKLVINVGTVKARRKIYSAKSFVCF